MKLHNTRTRSTDEFIPLDDIVRIYSCGPTVYDNIHIGNLRAFVAADMLRRALRVNGYAVQHVMNFTDIDDKTIRRSQEKYSGLTPSEALGKLTELYSNVFLTDMELIGNDTKALVFTKATDYIEQMTALIRELYSKDIAYLTDDGVYFSIEKYREHHQYGQLSEITTASTSEERIDNDEYDKDSAHDFALWKVQKANEPAWELELNGQVIIGRPGWHIECSAMSMDALGMPFDIHTGGVDLIFPHHENEIAQSLGATVSDVYAQFFIHNEHLLVDGKKMSKSLGNFYTLRDIQEKGCEPLAFRLEVLQSHYRSQTNFSWENLEAATNRLQGYRAMADLRFQVSFDSSSPNNSAYFDQASEAIKSALADDIDTPQSLTILSEVTDNMLTQNGALADEQARVAFVSFLNLVDVALGIQLANRQDVTSPQKETIAAREEARTNKDWQKSDELRAVLKEQGIGLNDTPIGTRWYRI